MSVIGFYAELFSSAADGVSDAMDQWLARRPADPRLVTLWNMEYTRLGQTATSLRSVSAHLYNLDAQVILDNVRDELEGLRQATIDVKDTIAKIHKVDRLLDVLGKFITLGVSIAAFAAAPTPMAAAGIASSLEGIVKALKDGAGEQAAAFAKPAVESFY